MAFIIHHPSSISHKPNRTTSTRSDFLFSAKISFRYSKTYVRLDSFFGFVIVVTFVDDDIPRCFWFCYMCYVFVLPSFFSSVLLLFLFKWFLFHSHAFDDLGWLRIVIRYSLYIYVYRHRHYVGSSYISGINAIKEEYVEWQCDEVDKR